MKKVSFQGEPGAYSESAAKAYAKKRLEGEITTIPCSTFKQVLDNTETGISDYSILPVENSIEGNVGESYDALLTSSVYAIGELYHKIEHCLIGSGKLEEIDTVYSHPQALGQCRNFLQDGSYKTVPTYDTAGSVKIVKDMNEKNVACIASKNAATIYNMPIIKENIENDSNNYTRFLILKMEKPLSGYENEDAKTSIVFSIKHESGALYKIIRIFNENKINLTKIESRPKNDGSVIVPGKKWEYNFYVDFIGHESNENITKVLSEIKNSTSFLKIIGSYPRQD